jgi:hypothetical protein
MSAILGLYDEQVLLGDNPAPKPKGLGLKCLERELIRSKWARDQKERVDRGENTIKDSYLPSQIPDHTRAVWQHPNLALALRTQVGFLLGSHMLLRSSNRLPLDLSQCFYLDLENEALQNGQAKLPARIQVVCMNYGKTNHHGNKEYGAAMRYRDPLCCLVGQLAMWLFYRWHIENEAFPTFIASENWYNIKMLR